MKTWILFSVKEISYSNVSNSYTSNVIFIAFDTISASNQNFRSVNLQLIRRCIVNFIFVYKTKKYFFRLFKVPKNASDFGEAVVIEFEQHVLCAFKISIFSNILFVRLLITTGLANY